MKQRPLPQVQPEVDLTQDSYNLLLDTFIGICDRTYQQFKQHKADVPNPKINDALLKQSQVIMKNPTINAVWGTEANSLRYTR